jgi:hypothetical protein
MDVTLVSLMCVSISPVPGVGFVVKLRHAVGLGCVHCFADSYVPADKMGKLPTVSVLLLIFGHL